MDLREKIADAIDYSGVVHDSDLKRAVIVQLADAILQIPEIAAALDPTCRDCGDEIGAAPLCISCAQMG